MPITLNGDTGITTPSYGGADTAEYLVPVTAFKNRIINGAMVIDQRNAGASVSINGTGTYTLDRWYSDDVSDGSWTIQQSSVAPPGFTNSLLVTITSADSSLGATERCRLFQIVEGFNSADFAWGTADAKTVTLSFWVRSSVTGTLSGALSNSAENRSYPFTYVVNSANTWEQKSITIAGDTTGTWLTNNGVGVRVLWSLGAGSNFIGAAGAWNSSYNFAATGATNLISTNGATFYITGVQFEVGTNATFFDARPYGTELQLCQRYYYKISNTGDATSVPFGLGYTRASNAVRPFINFPVPMRTRPLGVETSGTASHYSVYYAGDAIAVCNAVPDFDISSRETALLGAVVGGSPFPSGGVTYLRSNSTSAFLGFSAEL